MHVHTTRIHPPHTVRSPLVRYLSSVQKHAVREYSRAAERAKQDGKDELERVVILTSMLLNGLTASKVGNGALKYEGSACFSCFARLGFAWVNA